MKYSILGFNQEKIVDYSKDNLRCDLIDLLLLNYIIYAQSNPNMKHIMDEYDLPCVWLCHEHILEDLPIINITDGTLKNRLTKLRKMDLLYSKTVSFGKGNGTRTYYRTTSFLNEMIFDYTSRKNDVKDDYTSRKNDVKVDTRHFKMTTDNRQIKKDNKVDNVVSKDTTDPSNFLRHHSLLPKQSQNLYSKCVSQINDFTQDKNVRSALLEYLDFRLEKGRDVNKPLYSSMWKGMLNKLKKEFDEKDWVSVIQQSIERGWLSFFKDDWNNNTSSGKKFDPHSKTVHMTEEDKKRQKEFLAERKAKGLQVAF